jgi:transposase
MINFEETKKRKTMQLLLPIFPVDTKLITPSLGVYKHEDIVYYLHCGAPIFSHIAEDILSFRYITSKFILQKLCRKIEICECFGVSYDSVNRYVNKLEAKGDSEFFIKDNNRHGYAHKLLPEVIERIQKMLSEGKSNTSIARKEGLSEGTIRYAIKTGKLKKK